LHVGEDDGVAVERLDRRHDLDGPPLEQPDQTDVEDRNHAQSVRVVWRRSLS
jgi:hypothetical protein